MNHTGTEKQATRLVSLLVVVGLVVLVAAGSRALAAATEWTWMSGASTLDQKGTYGSISQPAPANVPGARDSSVSWFAGDGALWLFGGYGRDGGGITGWLNDLWRYDPAADPATGRWTWMSGASTFNQYGNYGTKGTPHATNVPGGRNCSVSWTGGGGSLWLFGGGGYGAAAFGHLNDLWRYDRSNGLWTWMSGSNATEQAGIYGVKGTPDDDNVPGGRQYGISWIDGDGHLWLFGGMGHDSAGVLGYLNDLWRYDTSGPTTGQWTWVSGASTINQAGAYGNKGTPDDDNVPGGRQQSISWIDGDGDLWLFGGEGRDSAGASGVLNDLWRYDRSTGWWTWVSGASTRNQVGVYGAKGAPAAANAPGGRAGSISWIDGAGALWLFGGWGYGSAAPGYLNDLWRYNRATGEWTWMSGASTINQAGAYGSQGTPAVTNVPGGRYLSISWIDGAGSLWLFGGKGYANVGISDMNDLWRYELPADVRFGAATYNEEEGAGSATITVTLSAASGLTVTVDYATADGTAAEPGDYAEVSGTLTFSPSLVTRTFTVPIVDDGRYEADETVRLALSDPANATLGTPYTATLTIQDDDYAVYLPIVLKGYQ